MQLKKRLASTVEQLVAGEVPEAVVDQLEAVEVEEQHGEQVAPAAAGPVERALQPLHEEGAVGQAGERIVGPPVA